jgi:peptide/nickel transport system permease protein
MGQFFLGLASFVIVMTLVAVLLRKLLISAVSANLKTVIKGMPLTAMFGVLIIIFFLILAIFAPFLAPYSETAIVGQSYEPWSSAHWLGTDNLGRDVLSRMIFAARNTIGVAIVITALSFVIGTSLGLSSAIIGGVYDLLLARLFDIGLAIPKLIFILLILSIVGPSTLNMVIAVAVIDSTRYFLLCRAVGMGVARLDFVEAAQLRGESLAWIARKEVLPNITAPLVAETGLRFCYVFLSIAALSFLGFGFQPPTADWGSMVKENATLINFGSPLPLLPALAIALMTVSVNFVADWVLEITSAKER